MITRFITSLTVSISPFSRSSRTARLLLSLLPSGARQSGVKVTTNILPKPVVGKDGKEENWVMVGFKDGKEIKLETSKMSIKDVVEELDRHSRLLARKEELAG